jgi:subfamily B ATP-binding cassette protein MsbA
MMRGSITSGGLVAFCLYAAQIVEPLRRLSDVHGFMQRGIAAAARVYGLIDATPQEVEGGLEPAPPLRGELCLESVDFAYGPDTEVLRELSFRVAPGENLAIVAASGGGKSTLASLLVRHADPAAATCFSTGRICAASHWLPFAALYAWSSRTPSSSALRCATTSPTA